MNKNDELKFWNICVVCGGNAVGCGLICDMPQSALYERVAQNNLQRTLYSAPHGYRMHFACIDKLKSYFAIRDQHATTSTLSDKPSRPILTLKKQSI